VAKLYPRALGSIFVACYDSQGYGGGSGSCGRPVCLSVGPQIFLVPSDICGLLVEGLLPWREDGSVIYLYNLLSLFDPSPAAPVTIFYCLILDSPNLEGQGWPQATWPRGRSSSPGTVKNFQFYIRVSFRSDLGSTKPQGAWSWQLISNWCRGRENVDLYIHSPTRLHGVAISETQGQLYPFYLLLLWHWYRLTKWSYSV
jgi:hypothetical protein